jgi:exopolysaccharide production protein ExoQ
MPPRLASLLTVIFIAFLFRRDMRERPNVTGALWLPTAWLFIIGSRYVSQWLALFGILPDGSSVEEGSPLDAVVFFSLIAAGLYVLTRRGVNFSDFAANNRLLTLFLIYCFLAITWSDYPLVSLKRWIKIVGHPVMVMILFTEPNLQGAITCLMKRCAYILIPVSVLFIKYYPEWGRGFSDWTGEGYNRGIALGKNDLGYVCLITGSFFFWHLLRIKGTEEGRFRKAELVLTSLFLVMISWLLWIANCKTALVAFLIAVLTMLIVGLQFVDKRSIGAYLVAAALISVAAEYTFGLSEQAIKLLGRNPTLTDRTEVWHDVLEVPINPILGTGFESFWLGERRARISEKWLWQPNQAHNGYIETYLNLGLTGLAILIALLVSTYRKACRELLENFEFGRLRLGLLFAVAFYNWTDATFKALHPIWFAFYVIAIDYPKPQVESPAEFSEAENGVATILDENGVCELVESRA